jgi:hypothetical protein
VQLCFFPEWSLAEAQPHKCPLIDNNAAVARNFCAGNEESKTASDNKSKSL